MLNHDERKVLASINKNEIIELTQELVRIDSVIRPETGGTEKEVVAVIADWIERELGITPLIEAVQPGRENIIATIESKVSGRCLMFEGHTDVVSEGNPDHWKHHPFGAVIDQGKIYGRGSCDMKGGLAVNLITIKTILLSGVDWKGKIRLGIVCDEEGMMTGIKDFIKKGHADDVDAALVSEPEENQLCLKMKGAIRAVVRVTGKMAHGAMPLTGINPNTRLARIILAFEQYESEEKERCGSDEFLGLPSITFTIIQAPPAGEPAQLNVMPGTAVAYVDIRTVPNQNHDQVRKDLLDILAGLKKEDKGFNADIEFIEDRPVVTMDKDEPIVIAAAEAYFDVTGKTPVYNGVPGATDGTFLRAWKNIPSLVNGPGPRHMPHQTDEYIEIDELYEAVQVYAVTVLRYLQG